MMCPRHIQIVIFIISVVFASSRSDAQTRDSVTARSGLVNLHTSRNLFAVPEDRTETFRQYLATAEFGTGTIASRGEASVYQASSGRQRSTARKVIGGIVGGVGGFFGGAFLGAAIEGDRCNCDDPGFVGFLIGAPIGATVGAILGVKFF